jgi:hypothetical protein
MKSLPSQVSCHVYDDLSGSPSIVILYSLGTVGLVATVNLKY